MNELTKKAIMAVLQEKYAYTDVLDAAANGLYDLIENHRVLHPLLYDMLNEYDTFTEYIAASSDEPDEVEQGVLEELENALYFAVFDCYDKACEETELQYKDAQSGKFDSYFLRDNYPEVFEEFEATLPEVYKKLLAENPMDCYKRADEAMQAYRYKHHILFDETDFIDAYNQSFSKEKLYELLKSRLKEVFKIGRHYELLVSEDEAEETDPYEEDLMPSNLVAPYEIPEEEQQNEILEPCGDLRKEDFTYVFQLLEEYTGRRILPADDPSVLSAYWTTYADDFRDILTYYVLDCYEALIDHLAENNPSKWNSFCRVLRLDKKDRTDAIVILDHSERLSLFLEDLIEQLWNEFTETRIDELI